MSIFTAGHQIDDFQPSSATIAKMLGMRTKPINVGVEHPGIFGDHEFHEDQKWFYLAVIFEIIGLFMIAYIMVAIRNKAAIWAFWTVLILVVLDIGGAWFHHYYKVVKNKVLIFENAVLEFSNEKNKQSRITENNRLKKINNNISIVFGVIIVCVAVFKVYDVIMLIPKSRTGTTGGNGMLIAAGLTVTYIFVAIIHLFKTGYYIWGSRAWKAWKKELQIHNTRKSNEGPKFKSEKTLESVYNLSDFDEYKNNDKLRKIGNHRIDFFEEAPKYKFVRRGILLDEEIEYMHGLAHDNINSKIDVDIIHAAMHLQLNLAKGLTV